jgi:DNA-binding GntR family transcriptional regulator
LPANLSARYGIQTAIADEVVEAGLARAEQTRLLRRAKGNSVFIFSRTSYVQ